MQGKACGLPGCVAEPVEVAVAVALAVEEKVAGVVVAPAGWGMLMLPAEGEEGQFGGQRSGQRGSCCRRRQ